MYKRPIDENSPTDGNSPKILHWLFLLILSATVVYLTYALNKNQTTFKETVVKQQEVIDKQAELISTYKEVQASNEQLINVQNETIDLRTRLLILYREKYTEATASR